MAIVTLGAEPVTMNGENVTIDVPFIPGIFVGRKSVAFNTYSGIADGVAIIYKIGTPLKSYKPGRTINGLTGFELNGAYYIVIKGNFDFGDAVHTIAEP